MWVSKKKFKEIEKRLDKLEDRQTAYSWELGKNIDFEELVKKLPQIINISIKNAIRIK